jgi:hypothetical protein
VLDCRPLEGPGGLVGWVAGDPEAPPTPVRYALGLGDRADTLRLAYRVGGEAFDYPVRLVTTPCHFGGARWRLVCPLAAGRAACGRRVGALYLAGRYFGCRACHRLTYASTQQSDRRVRVFVRGGFDFAAFDRLPRGSVSDLGFRLKVLDHHRRMLARGDRRLGD